MIVIVIFFALVAAVVLFVDFPQFRRDTLPAIRRTRAGTEPLTPAHRRHLAVVAACFAASAAGFWTLVAEGVRLSGWSRPLAVLSSVGLLAPLIWIYADWRGTNHPVSNGSGIELEPRHVDLDVPSEKPLGPRPPGL